MTLSRNMELSLCDKSVSWVAKNKLLFFVTPAKAGAQQMLVYSRFISLKLWIPASAGMTIHIYISLGFFSTITIYLDHAQLCPVQLDILSSSLEITLQVCG